ncbi:hypothetical protein [Alistipes putredinis]|uniref:hypothetical protein n=1 Tax=Alistipes putredinis TaxID=28117 RepID=UPI003AB799AD
MKVIFGKLDIPIAIVIGHRCGISAVLAHNLCEIGRIGRVSKWHADMLARSHDLGLYRGLFFRHAFFFELRLLPIADG